MKHVCALALTMFGCMAAGCSREPAKPAGVNIQANPNGVSVQVPGADVKAGSQGVGVKAGGVDVQVNPPK